MQFAKSILSGGIIIDAADGDYEICRKKSLVCVICNEPVFWRKSFTRKRGKKTSLVPAHFVHYAQDKKNPLDCENRLVSKAGRDRLEQIQIEARGQRLELFNRHIWDIFVANGCKTPATMRAEQRQVKEMLGKDYIKAMTQLCQEYWHDNFPKISESLEQLCFEFFELPYKEALKERSHCTRLPERRKHLVKMRESLSHKSDRRLHLTICQEILNFLLTKKSQFCWLKLIACTLKSAMEFYGWNSSDKTMNKAFPELMVALAIEEIICTHWAAGIEEVIQKK